MKKLLIICVMILSACAKEENFLYQGNTLIKFLTSSSNILESQDSPIFIVLGVTSSEGKVRQVTATFEIVSNTPDLIVDSVITILNETSELNFRNGIFDTIWIQPKNNKLADGSKQVVVNITKSNVDVGLPGTAANFSEHKIVINDDDCELDINLFNRQYNVCEIGFQEIDAPVRLGTDQNTLVIENLGDWGAADCIVELNSDVSSSRIEILRIRAGSVGGASIYWTGFGNYIACTGEFQLTYQLTFEDGSPWPPGTGTDVFTIGENSNCNPLF